MVILLKMPADHLADGDDQERPALILIAIKSQERAVRRVNQLEPARDTAHQGMAIFQEIVFRGGGIKSALWIKDIETREFIEADRDLMIGGGQSATASRPEDPGAEKARHARHMDTMNPQRRRQGGHIPAPGV